ncbi:MAG TPA: M48 family metalloprotease [Planctomycetota bacterium]|nr:M48 family metalloprotease [Planctomycetota bacterium]
MVPHADAPSRLLEPLPYHRDVVSYLKTHEPALWKWYSSAGSREKYADAIRLDLLKSTYRLDRASHEELYAAADAVCRTLELDVNTTLYQAQTGPAGHNAGICCLSGEAHIILHGDLKTVLSPLEMQALLGHELAHYRLLTIEDGAYSTAGRILDAVEDHAACPESYAVTAHRYRRYTEIYADRGALLACKDLNAVVGCLVKVSTGITDVNAESYLAQADEIFGKSVVTDQGLTHPQSFVRARAARLWSHGERDCDNAVRNMIDGPLAMNALDLLNQHALLSLTRRFIAEIIQPAWFRTDPVLAHARLFFPDFSPDRIDRKTPLELHSFDPSVRDYFCYILLDFVSADPSLDEIPLARALELSDTFGARERFEELANKELRITKKTLSRLRKEGAELLAKANGAA